MKKIIIIFLIFLKLFLNTLTAINSLHQAIDSLNKNINVVHVHLCIITFTVSWHLNPRLGTDALANTCY